MREHAPCVPCGAPLPSDEWAVDADCPRGCGSVYGYFCHTSSDECGVDGDKSLCGY